MRALTLLSTLTIFSLALACQPAAEEPAPVEEAAEPQLALYVFDCGDLELTDTSAFGLTAEEAGTSRLFVPCYLVRHPEGDLLWDAGLPPATAEAEDGVPMEGGVLRLARTLDAQLADLELTPADVDYVAFSHMHFDHVGHANLFADSTLLIQRAEHEAAFADEVPEIFDPTLYADLATSETVLLDGDHDVFGDGRVVIKSAPGHTPGHQVLFVDLEETGPLVLSGDLYHFEASRELRRTPVFNTDAEMTLASMDRIEAFLEDEGATLWIEHNAELADTLKKAPDFYN